MQPRMAALVEAMLNSSPSPETEPLAAAIETGDIHLIGGNAVAAELIDRFLANPDLVVDEIAGNGFQSVFANPWREPNGGRELRPLS